LKSLKMTLGIGS